MQNPLRLGAIAALLGLALPAAADAATIRLVPLAPATVAPSITTCAVPYAPARLLTAPLEIPSIAAQQGISGTAEVVLRLDAQGRLRSEAISVSSGNRWLDAAARRAARLARYTPEVFGCERVGGEYAMVVDFTE